MREVVVQNPISRVFYVWCLLPFCGKREPYRLFKEKNPPLLFCDPATVRGCSILCFTEALDVFSKSRKEAETWNEFLTKHYAVPLRLALGICV